MIVSISDTEGKTVYTEVIRTYEKSLNTYVLGFNKELARGTYILSIYTGRKNFMVKFISQQ